MVAVDGSRFKAVNTRDKNFTPGAVRRRIEQAEASIARYLQALDTADRQEGETAELRGGRIKDRLASLRRQVRELQTVEADLATAPDGQISLTDPDARAMATNGKGTGMVGYNVQAVVDAQHHLIVAHEVTNQGHDRSQLANMTRQAKAATGCEELRVLADRGYFSGEEILACEQAGATPLRAQAADLRGQGAGAVRQGRLRLPCRRGRLPLPGGPDAALAHGDGGARDDASPLLGPRQLRRLRDQRPMYDEQGAADHPLGARGRSSTPCSIGWTASLTPCAPRRQTVEHVFGTLKAWMGATPLQDQTAEERRRRDELAGAGLQPEARYRHPRRQATDLRNAGLRDAFSAPPSPLCASATDTFSHSLGGELKRVPLAGGRPERQKPRRH